MNHHGAGGSVVTDGCTMLADPGAETTSCFAAICFITLAAGFAAFGAGVVVSGRRSVSYYIAYLYTGCAGIFFYCISKISSDRLRNIA